MLVHNQDIRSPLTTSIVERRTLRAGRDPRRTGRLAGWICWGPTPCTLGTFDLYWMAVDPALHGAGIGTALIGEMERRLSGVARLVVVETAGRPDYRPTRAFYQARGYRAAAVIPDFYAPGDDQVVYLKSLATG